jgi:hypothetical protein
LSLHLASALNDFVSQLYPMDGDSNHPAGVDQTAGNMLADPPSAVGGKAIAQTVVEFIDRAQEAKIAFLDQIEKSQSAVHVPFGDAHYQP